MRFQARGYRAQSFAFKDKENKNYLNINPNQENQNKERLSLPYRQDHKNNQKSTNVSIVSQLLKKDKYPQNIKQTYTKFVITNYSSDILSRLIQQSSSSVGFLANHTISTSLRSKMIDWKIQVLSSYKMSEQVFFKSVAVMDNFLKMSRKPQDIKDLHLIGVASMLLACKYQEIYPIKLDVFHDKIARKKFTKEEILLKESQIIQALNFKMQIPTIYQLVMHFQTLIQMNVSSSIGDYFKQIALYLSKMSVFNIDLAQQNQSLLAPAVYFIALKTLQQIQKGVNPQGKLNVLCNLVNVQQQKVIQISRKVLQLAKNFSKVYPNLTNLKKFNKFQYKPSAN